MIIDDYCRQKRLILATHNQPPMIIDDPKYHDYDEPKNMMILHIPRDTRP